MRGETGIRDAIVDWNQTNHRDDIWYAAYTTAARREYDAIIEAYPTSHADSAAASVGGWFGLADYTTGLDTHRHWVKKFLLDTSGRSQDFLPE